MPVEWIEEELQKENMHYKWESLREEWMKRDHPEKLLYPRIPVPHTPEEASPIQKDVHLARLKAVRSVVVKQRAREQYSERYAWRDLRPLTLVTVDELTAAGAKGDAAALQARAEHMTQYLERARVAVESDICNWAWAYKEQFLQHLRHWMVQHMNNADFARADFAAHAASGKPYRPAINYIQKRKRVLSLSDAVVEMERDRERIKSASARAAQSNPGGDKKRQAAKK